MGYRAIRPPPLDASTTPAEQRAAVSLATRAGCTYDEALAAVRDAPLRLAADGLPVGVNLSQLRRYAAAEGRRAPEVADMTPAGPWAGPTGTPGEGTHTLFVRLPAEGGHPSQWSWGGDGTYRDMDCEHQRAADMAGKPVEGKVVQSGYTPGHDEGGIVRHPAGRTHQIQRAEDYFGR